MRSVDELVAKKREAIRLRLRGLSLAEVKDRTGLSVPTIIKAVEAFKAAGWQGVEPQVRGRKPINASAALDENTALLASLKTCSQQTGRFLTLDQVRVALGRLHKPVSKKTLLRRVERLFPDEGVQTIFAQAAGMNMAPHYKMLVLGFYHVAGEKVFYTQDRRGERRFYCPVTTSSVSSSVSSLSEADLVAQLDILIKDATLDKPFCVVIKTDALARFSLLARWQVTHQKLCWLLSQGELMAQAVPKVRSKQSITELKARSKMEPKGTDMLLTHLQRLEAESIHIMREVVAEAENPVMLYSIGKDSAVMLHIAMKAFYPSLPPFPLLHVDTRWKFREMYEFRDKMVKELGLELISHINPDGIAKNINPFTHGSATHTDIMKTEGLKQALNEHKFDVAFGGARRDEEKSRAKERVFSFRTADHRWDPKNQRPEIWKQYNTRKNAGESIRVFPISNWTELDIWQYIHLENIPIVPLYYSKPRPVVDRDGTLIMVDDERMPLKPGEVPMMKSVRFRTLGCYPLTGAVESDADTLPAIIQEMLLTRTSERQGRMIDHDSAASMEKKKQEGYF